CLQIKDDLFDFNTITDVNASSPFPQFNNEVIMVTLITNTVYYSISTSFAQIDSLLYNSYSDNDLRKTAFFKPSNTGYNFKGSYSGTPSKLFIGIATDEVYLMRAECLAREGNRDDALKDLNKLMETKWKSGLFIPLTANTASNVLTMILEERRKELIFRNLRWMDIKRRNIKGANIILTRLVNGRKYSLPPNDNRYALPLPLDIIARTGIVQNPK
ncbi:MAG TPA: RagB/SusD family nutrient uptake outer membrane protein, partial [Sphingobacteriaceae bacterium]|nr:RagB/SusD family nutrient uptake outer membrane protein [Sphingobacteriaceae bacterium]